mgnify:CR=1 FL=1
MTNRSTNGRDLAALVLAVLWIGGFGSIAALLILRSGRHLPSTRVARAARAIAWVGLALCVIGGIVVVLASGSS